MYVTKCAALQIYSNTRKAIRLWLLRTLKPCAEMVPLMSESLERRLNGRARFALRLHLLVCAWCSRYLQQLKLIGAMLRSRTFDSSLDEARQPSLSAAARNRIAVALSDAKQRANKTQNS